MLIHAFQRIEEDGMIYTNCFSSVDNTVAAPAHEEEEIILIDADNVQPQESEKVASTPKAPRGKRIWKALKNLTKSETLFGDDLSNEV